MDTRPPGEQSGTAGGSAAERSAGELRFDAMLLDHNAVMLLIDPVTGRIVDANPSAAQFYGYSVGELRSMRIDQINMMPAGEVADRLAAATSHRLGHFVFPHRLSSGEIRRVDVHSSPIGDDLRPLLFSIIIDVEERVRAEEKLSASEEMLRAVLDGSGDSVMRLDRDQRVEYVNQRIVAISGRPFDEWVGRTHSELGYPADLVRIWEANNRRVFDTGVQVTYEFRIDNAGQHQWFETSVSPVFGPDGSVAHVIATSRDISARRQAEIELRVSREQLERAQRIAHIGTWTLDIATSHVTWSEELSLMLGLDPGGAPPDLNDQALLFTPESWLRLGAAIAQIRKDGVPYEAEFETVRADGSRGWMLARGEAVRDAGGAIVGVQGVAMDITERKVAIDELQSLATHDPLTGLSNRVALLGEIARALSAGNRSGRATAVLMLDLDRFKVVNDTLGHAAGDELLVAAARRLENAVRAGDLVARLGGDEFVAVMRELDDPRDAVRAADRLVEVFRSPFTPGGSEVFSTASIGVAIATDPRDADDLLREADTAMYAAKEQGRDRASVFVEDQHAAVTARLSVETDLRRALERGELSVWYQPEIDLATGSVTAVEALLRWQRADGTVWAADRFIHVAEETGLILGIGDWVLHQACVQGAAWAVASPDRPITVRVNVSGIQLAERGLIGAIDDALATSGLDPSLLCVEITETALLPQSAAASENLDGIHDRGISIALDDFGTGYASLSYLNTYPIDLIKIDRSFITDPTSAQHDHRLVAAIVSLAKTLGITVTAEGVEHPDQAIHLRQMGCPGASGWLYSKALPPDQITPLLDHIYPHD